MDINFNSISVGSRAFGIGAESAAEGKSASRLTVVFAFPMRTTTILSPEASLSQMFRPMNWSETTDWGGSSLRHSIFRLHLCQTSRRSVGA